MGKKAAAPSPPPAETPDEPVKEEPWEEHYGEFTFPDGSTYRGQYLKKGSELTMHGTGVLKRGPETFDGMFANGQYKSGTYTGCNGSVYEGNFCDNRFHGRGSYTWPDGRVYTGMWKEGKMHGRGQYMNFSFGVNKVYAGFSIGGHFESSRQQEAREAYLAEYSQDYVESATAALRDLSSSDPPPAQYLVPSSAPGDEVCPERAATEAVVDGPYPDASAIKLAPLQAFLSRLSPESEKPVRVTLLEEQKDETCRFDTQRLRTEQLEHVGQCVEFTSDLTDYGSVSKVVLVNVNADFVVTCASWKLVQYDVVPYPEGEAPEEHETVKDKKKGK